MAAFRVTYHTTGGPFSRSVEAESAEAAQKEALAALSAGGTLAFVEKEVHFALLASQIAAVSVEADKAPPGSERRGAGFLGR